MSAARSDPPAARTGSVAALALVVAVVLGDSGVVTLALPEILRDFGSEVGDVAWVLMAFNLVLALVAVPAARGLRPRRPGRGDRGRPRRLRGRDDRVRASRRRSVC